MSINAATVAVGAVLRPTSDNARDLGSGSERWKEIFAGNATVNTSDENEKEQIGAIPDAWLDAWGDVQHCRFKWRDAVAEKGEKARWHTGLIAQQIERAFAARGLDAFELGLLCRDELYETTTRTLIEQREVTEDVEEEYMAEERYGDGVYMVRKVRTSQQVKTEILPVFGADGKPTLERVPDPDLSTPTKVVYKMAPATRRVAVMEDVEVEIEERKLSGKFRYGVRYSEAEAMEAAWVRREISRLRS